MSNKYELKMTGEELERRLGMVTGTILTTDTYVQSPNTLIGIPTEIGASTPQFVVYNVTNTILSIAGDYIISFKASTNIPQLQISADSAIVNTISTIQGTTHTVTFHVDVPFTTLNFTVSNSEIDLIENITNVTLQRQDKGAYSALIAGKYSVYANNGQGSIKLYISPAHTENPLILFDNELIFIETLGEKLRIIRNNGVLSYYKIEDNTFVEIATSSIEELGRWFVSLDTSQTIDGKKTFTTSPIAPNPTQINEVATKGYVDNIEQTKITKYVQNNFANAIKQTASGSSVVIANDVSPIEHNVECKITSVNPSALTVVKYGKNLITFDGRTVADFGASSNTTVRNIKPNIIVLGLASNNYYIPNYVRSFKIDPNNKITVNVTSYAGYGVGLNIRCYPHVTYYINSIFDAINGSVGVSFYDAEGNWLASKKNTRITAPENSYWMFIIYTPTIGEQDIVFSNNMISLYELASDEFEAAKQPAYYIPEADGTVKNINSLSPNMSLLCPGATMTIRYNTNTQTYVDESIAANTGSNYIEGRVDVAQLPYGASVAREGAALYYYDGMTTDIQLRDGELIYRIDTRGNSFGSLPKFYIFSETSIRLYGIRGDDMGFEYQEIQMGAVTNL